MKIYARAQIEARCKQLELQDTTESRELCQMLRYQQELIASHRAEATHNRMVALRLNKQMEETLAKIREIAA